jgi:hypothetical protein
MMPLAPTRMVFVPAATNHNRRRGARDAWHVVMLGDPKPAIAPSFSMRGEIARIVECSACAGILRDADQIEYRKRCHGELLTDPLPGGEGGQLPAEIYGRILLLITYGGPALGTDFFFKVIRIDQGGTSPRVHISR